MTAEDSETGRFVAVPEMIGVSFKKVLGVDSVLPRSELLHVYRKQKNIVHTSIKQMLVQTSP
jgi:hypothetical protein